MNANRAGQCNIVKVELPLDDLGSCGAAYLFFTALCAASNVLSGLAVRFKHSHDSHRMSAPAPAPRLWYLYKYIEEYAEQKHSQNKSSPN